jgi:nicotinamidase/pyrazinamidase
MERSPPPAHRGDGLLVVDVQRDFLPGGALAVPAGDEVVPVLNRYLARWRLLGLPVFASRDWHPTDHLSFRDHGGPWPPHCVAGSVGAQFAPGLALPRDVEIVSTGVERDCEGYSAFDRTDLDDRLRRGGVRRLFVGGLATDYCVRHTVHDALAHGYAVALLVDAIRAIDRRPGDGRRAEMEMSRRGASRVRLDALAA